MNSFARACEDGRFDDVRKMLDTDTISRMELFQQTDANGLSLSHWAAYHSNIEFMKYLITFKEFNINAKDNHGRTALLTAMFPRYTESIHQHAYVRFPPTALIEMVKVLFEANNDLINYRDQYGVSPLEYAIRIHHFDVVKFLVDLGASVNHEYLFGYYIFHSAALHRRIDCLTYLLYKTDCDPAIPDCDGWPPCCRYVRYLLMSPRLSKEDIKFAIDFIKFTYKSPAEEVQVYFLLLDCFNYRHLYYGHADAMFLEIVNLLLPKHRSRSLLEKILKASAPLVSFSIITLTLFESINKSIDKCTTVVQKHRYMGLLEELKSYFLGELFTICSTDESVFNEYIAEVHRLGGTFKKYDEMQKFCAASTAETPSQKVFNFMNDLLLHGSNFISYPQPSYLLLQQYRSRPLSNVLLPFDYFPMWTFQKKESDPPYNFNEYHEVVEKKSNSFEVISLKNLSRMSVRKYYFENYSHYGALSLLYSLDIPIILRQFLCYKND